MVIQGSKISTAILSPLWLVCISASKFPAYPGFMKHVISVSVAPAATQTEPTSAALLPILVSGNNCW